ncbi:MAG: dicarboxylate/amino acid:cation symporter [Acholeplasma sp.]|jgi:Na+/H+-dicarboxylate symporter|nr:dicarboxylate/amino acid:cation symporter [Acholeplasma sp.]CCY27554.1 sodium:dicarboxylate symporter [Acholeplasma sp. CAG:878]
MTKKSFWKTYRFPIILLLSVILGCVLGIVLENKAMVIKPFGTIFINMLYTIVVPLVFFTISSSIANMVSLRRLGKILKYVFIVFIITSLISAIVMLFTIKIFNPVGNASITLTAGSEEVLSIADQIVSAITVTDFKELLSRSNMLPLIIFSILFGIGIALVGEKGKNVAKNLDAISNVMMKIIKIIMYYAPIGLCAYFAALVGEFGPELLGSYARSMFIYYILSIVYFAVFYTLYSYMAGKKEGIKAFYKAAPYPTATSLATQSSLASLPVNLEAASSIDVPKDIREVTLPIGATMHMEGSSMGAILKIAFLFAIFNRPFVGVDTYLIALLISVLSAVVMSGIPGGGLIGEMLIVSLYGFPMEAFPIIATIGWLIDPPATCLNVVGDLSSSMLVTRIVEGKNWLKSKIKNVV